MGARSQALGTGVSTLLLYPGDYSRMKVRVRNVSGIVHVPVPRADNKRRKGLTRLKAVVAMKQAHIAETIGSTAAACGDDCFRTVSRQELYDLREDYYTRSQPEQATLILEHLNSRAEKAPFFLFGRAFCSSCFCRAFHITGKHLYDLRKRINENGSK